MTTVNPTHLPAADAPPPLKVLRPRRGWASLDFASLWQFRDLLLLLALRDIQVRYKQAVLGAAWAVLQPLVMMIALTLFIGRFLGVSEMQNPVFVYAGLLPWTFFATAVTASANSLVANANMMRKVYFPRLIPPVAAIGAPLVDYAISFVVLIGLMAWFGVVPSGSIALLPLLVLITIIAAAGVGIALAGLIVSYRDFRFVVPFLVQIWMLVSPVMYPAMPENWRPVLALNPMGGTLEAFRAAVVGTPIHWDSLLQSTGSAVLILLVGLVYFQRVERRFADVV